MHSNSHSYLMEKLTDALSTLATHPGDARERLVAAHLSLHTLEESDFPEEFQAEWISINEALTKFGPLLFEDGRVLRSSVENTMRRVRRTTAAKIAKRIYDLYWALSTNVAYN